MPAQMLAGAGRHEANHQLPPPAPPPITTTSRALSFSSSCVHGSHPPPLRSLGPSPEATDARKRVGMEAKKKSGPSAAAAAAGAGAGAAPPPPNGYFSTVFSSSPAGNAKDSKQTDLYAMLNKQSARGQNGSSISSDSKSQGRTTYKDGKHTYPNESESPYFGSSVHYGGREFYSSPQQKQPANEPPRSYKEDNPDGSATRGDWWQGSLYY